MKLHIVSILAAIIAAASTFNASAADERNGRVIPLAKKACFGYTQIIGDRLCLFNTDCRPIADYSAYSQIDASNNMYIINDDTSVYFYNPDGMLFLALPADTEYSQYKDSIIFTTSIGYTACTVDGKMYSLSYEDAQKAAEAKGYDEYVIRLFDDKFYIANKGGYNGIPIDSILAGEKFMPTPDRIGNYYVEDVLENGNYLIYKVVRGGAYEYGVCDNKGNIIISPRFSVAHQLSNGMWNICSTHSSDSYKYAIEKEITASPDFIYDSIRTDFGDGLIGVRLGARKLYLNEDLEPVLDLSDKEYDLGTFHDGRADVFSYKYGGGIIDLNGDILLRACDFGNRELNHKKNLVYMSKSYREKYSSVVYLPSDTLPMKEHILPADNGEIKQPYYSTDIKVTIDGETIQSCAVDGRMMIYADALAEHGFSVHYNDDTRILIANRDVSCENRSAYVASWENTVGKMLGYTVKSDIGVYINGRYIETEAIDGQLLIEAEALCAPPDESDPDYWMLKYLGISPYLMSGEYDDNTRTLSIHTYTE